MKKNPAPLIQDINAELLKQIDLRQQCLELLVANNNLRIEIASLKDKLTEAYGFCKLLMEIINEDGDVSGH